MARITFRDLRPDDAEDLHAVVSDWSVVRQLGGWPWPPELAFTRGRARAHAGEGFVWAICKDDRVIGSIGFTDGSVGYMLRKDMHGQGIGTQALSHTLHAAFEDQAVDTVTATTWIDNDASHRLLLAHGFFHYRTEYQRAKARRHPVLSRTYRLTRDAWHRLRSTAQ